MKAPWWNRETSRAIAFHVVVLTIIFSAIMLVLGLWDLVGDITLGRVLGTWICVAGAIFLICLTNLVFDGISESPADPAEGELSEIGRTLRKARERREQARGGL